VAVLIAVLIAMTTACSAAATDSAPRMTQNAPAPFKMPENESRVTARVLEHTIHPPGSITSGRPVRPNLMLHSYTVEISKVAPGRPDVISLAKPGTIEAFSLDPLPPNLVGREISATVTLTGDNRGTRWFISDIRP
jgi:hypothetical protein